MDTLFEGFPGSVNGFKFEHGSSVSSCSNQNLVNGFKLINNSINHHPPFLETNPHPPAGDHLNSDGDSPDSSDFSNAVLKYISEILMEEDLEEKPCMLQDCLALQAAEKSFYDVLGQKYPPSPNHVLLCLGQNIDSPDDHFTSSSSSSTSSDHSFSTSTCLVDSPESNLLVPNLHSEIESLLKREGVNFAPQISPPKHEKGVVLNSAEDGRHRSSYGSRGRKNDQREDSDYLEQGRRSKLSAVSLAVSDVKLEMFDEVLLCHCKPEKDESESCSSHRESENGSSKKLQQNGQSKGSSGGTTRGKKRGDKREVVDLSSLLTLCAQAVAINDQRTANEQLKQIRQHSSAFGDGTQRLAHYFADALEARLLGAHTPMHTHICCRTSAADILKGYQMYVSACPFSRMSYLFANQTIRTLAEKATRLHIIDFGIGYGFQWPCLIQFLSNRPTGPPMLRITGIDLPQPGFRPAQRVEETGNRLKSYCERFNVPFEYNVIAQKWETIRLEDLKIDRDEVTVVNCMHRMKNLPDDTVVDSSPRDAVLNLIKRINPDVFIHGISNGTHNAPFFLTRFREALFHFSALFDMFDATVPREDAERMLFEREIVGKDALNAIACEGIERVERPETYKQWQARNQRAGFRQLPLDQELVKKVRTKVRSNYHQDFVVDVDGRWMLQGWKGRVTFALSVWKPYQD